MKKSNIKRLVGIIFLLLATVAIIAAGVKTYFNSAAPKISLNGEASETVALHSTYTDKGVTISGPGENRAKLETVGTVDTETRGTYTIEYILRYRKKTASLKRTVTVVDYTPPELKLNGQATVTVSKKSFFKDPGVTATDNLDGDLTSKVTVSEQPNGADAYTITYTVIDSDGNKASITRELKIKDLVKPVIKLKGYASMVIVQGSPYSDPGATATDDADGDISAKIAISGSIDTSRARKQTITYTAKDSAGNTATVLRTVTVITKQQAESSKIYLTFDDGPSTKVTPRVLDILKQNNVKATFFILNYGSSTKPIVQRILNEGHTIGIHGYTHDWTVYKSDAAYLENITKLNDKLNNDFGYTTKLIRFLGGSSNTISKKYSPGIMTRLTAKVQQQGYIYHDWNVGSNDAMAGKPASADYIYTSVTKNLKHGRNNIVLCHDTNAKSTTADALQRIIDYGKNNGYTFAALTPDVPPSHHKVTN